MPQGIVPELLIFIALLAIVGAVLFVARRPKAPPPVAPEEPAAPTEPETTTVPQPTEEPVETAAPTTTAVVERPSLSERLTKSRKFLSDRLADALHGTPDEE